MRACAFRALSARSTEERERQRMKKGLLTKKIGLLGAEKPVVGPVVLLLEMLAKRRKMPAILIWKTHDKGCWWPVNGF